MSWSGHAGGSDAAAMDLAARAKAGDQAALQQLYAATGIAGNPDAWRPDHRNAAIDAWNTLGIGQPIPDIKNPHHGILGAVGDVLKVAAPIGAAFIPGIGPIAAGAIAAGGSAAGGLMKGEPFNLGKTLMAGAAGAGGNFLLGGKGIGGISGVPGKLGLGGSAAGAPGSAGGSGILDSVMKYGPLVTGALGTYGAYQDASKANQLRDAATNLVQQDYAGRAPFRLAATQALTRTPVRPDLSNIFADPGNPFNRVRAPQAA